MSVDDNNQIKSLDQVTIAAIILLNQSSHHFVSHSLFSFKFIIIYFSFSCMLRFSLTLFQLINIDFY
jgi:hypothetical protein